MRFPIFHVFLVLANMELCESEKFQKPYSILALKLLLIAHITKVQIWFLKFRDFSQKRAYTIVKYGETKQLQLC